MLSRVTLHARKAGRGIDRSDNAASHGQCVAEPMQDATIADFYPV